MRMRRESPAARDRVVVEDAQRPESNVVRVVIAVETEQPVRRQPVALQMKSVFGLDDLHISSFYGFTSFEIIFVGPPARDRSKMRRPLSPTARPQCRSPAGGIQNPRRPASPSSS